MLSRWLDSGGPRELGLTEYGKERIQAALLRLGEPLAGANTLMLEVVVPRPLELSQRQAIQRGLAVALEAGNLGGVTGGGYGGGITDFFVEVVELSAGLAAIRRVLREHESAVGAFIKQYEPIQVWHRLEE